MVDLVGNDPTPFACKANTLPLTLQALLCYMKIITGQFFGPGGIRTTLPPQSWKGTFLLVSQALLCSIKNIKALCKGFEPLT